MSQDHVPGNVVVIFKTSFSLKEVQQAIDEVNKQVGDVCLKWADERLCLAVVKVPEGREMECAKLFEQNPDVDRASLSPIMRPA